MGKNPQPKDCVTPPYPHPLPTYLGFEPKAAKLLTIRFAMIVDASMKQNTSGNDRLNIQVLRDWSTCTADKVPSAVHRVSSHCCRICVSGTPLP